MPLPSLPPSASGGPSSQMEVRQYTQQLAANLDAGRVAQAKVLESVKFELDVRGSLLEKQLEAVREEMQSTMVATEKKWLDIAKGVETSTSAAIAAESASAVMSCTRVAARSAVAVSRFARSTSAWTFAS
jgi:hypothetical protein